MPIIFIPSLHSFSPSHPITHHYLDPSLPAVFPPSMWSPGSSYRHKPSPFPIKKREVVNMDHNAHPNAGPYDRLPQQQRHDRFHRPLYFAEESDFSDTEYADAYSLDTDTTVNDRLHSPYLAHRHTSCPSASSLRRVQVRMPKRMADNLRDDDVLLLSPDLTRLRIHIRASHSIETIHAAVPGNMRLRDVVKQVLSDNYGGEVLVQIKLRGEWLEFSGSYNISEIMDGGKEVLNSRQEVEVRVTIGGGRKRQTRVDARGWEHEIGHMERMRVY